MKNRNAQAQILSETLDQIREDLLLQAHDVDTAEKFHALNGKMAVAVVKDRPVTVFHKAVAIAVSLAVAAALAFGVTALVRQFPGIWNPDPTDPHMTQPPTTTQTDPTTEPTQTTIPTEPTEPTKPTEPTNPTEPTEPTAPTEPDVPNPSGTCGENITWTLDLNTKTLTFSGHGEMICPSDRLSTSPWQAQREDILKIVIEEGITSIFDKAFMYLWYVTTVSLPDSMQTIGNDAFNSCKALQKINLHDGISYIGTGAFYSCNSLIQVHIPAGLTVIYNYTFQDCHALQSVVLPEGITSIGNNAFYNCKALRKMIVPDSVTEIGSDAFSNCISLQTLELSNNLKTVYRIFSGCSSLEEVIIPDSVTKLHLQTLNDCTALQKLYIGANVSDFNDAAQNCGRLEKFSVSPNNPYLSVDDYGVLFNKDQTELLMAPPGFQGEYVVPISVLTISRKAFYSIQGLTSVTIPASVTFINSYAFHFCANLTEVIFWGYAPDTLSNAFIGVTANAYHFNSIPGWTNERQEIGPTMVWYEVDMDHTHTAERFPGYPATCTAPGISDGTRCSHCGLEIIARTEISALGHSMGKWEEVKPPTFEEDGLSRRNCANCDYYEEQVIEKLAPIDGTCGNGVTWKIRNSILTISGSGDVTSIEWQYYRANITKVIVEDGVTALCNNAFAMCTQLKEVIIADSVIQMGNATFENCIALTKVTLPANITSIGKNTFNGCTSLRQLVIPDSVTVISQWAFAGCESLTEITLPQSLTTIENSAFNSCSALGEISFPSSVASIGDYAFHNCSSLKTLYFYCDPPTIEQYTFYKVNASAYYPSGNEKWEQNGLGNQTGSITLYPKTSAGSCGDNLTWTYSNGVLTISGTGDMYDYSNRNVPPWREYAAQITKLILPDGLTRISTSAFVGFSGITYVEIPNSVTSIGAQAFSECSALTSLVIPDSVEQIGNMAFNQCTGLQTVTIGTGITSIEMYAFQNCYMLMEVHFRGDMPTMEEAFYGLVLTIYYPADNDTWDTGKVSTYETYITWIPVEMAP